MGELFDRARKRLAEVPFVGGRVEALAERHGAHYRERAERHLAALLEHLGGDLARLDAACTAFLEMTFDVLRLQNGFYRTGRFALEVEADAMAEIYANSELMPGRYLTGLYLAQMFWDNHYEKLLFFEDAFLPRLADGARLLDVGTGPGTYAILARERRPGLAVTANDISPHSRPMLEGLLAARTGARDGVEFAEGDFTALFAGSGPRFDAVVFSEVVEHLPDPQAGMRQLARLLAPGGLVFFTTATNAAFYDHTIVFERVGEIEALVERHGFDVLTSVELTVSEGPDGRDLIDYDAVLRRRG